MDYKFPRSEAMEEKISNDDEAFDLDTATEILAARIDELLENSELSFD